MYSEQIYLTENIVPYKHLGFELSLVNGLPEIRVPLDLNSNDKGTLFAGSIASAFSLTGWASVNQICRSMNLEVNIVLAESHTKFLTPVNGDSHSRCSMIDPKLTSIFLKGLTLKKRSSIWVSINLVCENKICASFQGRYAAQLKNMSQQSADLNSVMY